ncbi:MAG: hypothetical protein KC731_17145 [Myxococcales bacterium]|nr:hypothetical protein [Myxococcales bacterium]
MTLSSRALLLTLAVGSGWVLGCAGSPPPEVVVPPVELRSPRHGGAPLGPSTFAADEDEEPGEPFEGADLAIVTPTGSPPSKPVIPGATTGACLRSPLCKLEGFCSPNAGGLCIAADSDDCAPSDACLGGRCTARDGECIAGSDEDCRGSWACRGWGLCSHDGDRSCIATSAADCQASTRCQREGECRLADAACVK